MSNAGRTGLKIRACRWFSRFQLLGDVHDVIYTAALKKHSRLREHSGNRYKAPRHRTIIIVCKWRPAGTCYAIVQIIFKTRYPAQEPLNPFRFTFRGSCPALQLKGRLSPRNNYLNRRGLKMHILNEVPSHHAPQFYSLPNTPATCRTSVSPPFVFAAR